MEKIRLHHLFDEEEIHQMCSPLNFEFRDRVFTPAITLGLFVSQVLSRSDACSTVMANFVTVHGLSINFGAGTPSRLAETASQRALPAVVLAMLWCWETWHPFFGQRSGRFRHAGRNLAIAVFNTVVVALMFGSLTAYVAYWADVHQVGLLNLLGLSDPIRFGLALILLDGWMYVWHRANHSVPLLWRFHRMHHSDRNMDVTTATRFHFGEQVLSSLLRLGLIPLLGIQVWNLVVYDTVVLCVIMFHHADISLSRWDRWLRCLIVTPDMHKVHHSDWQPETDSNFSTVLSIWDRMAMTFRMRPDPKTIVFGLQEFKDSSWQTWFGMWKTPFIAVKRMEPQNTSLNPNEEADVASP